MSGSEPVRSAQAATGQRGGAGAADPAGAMRTDGTGGGAGSRPHGGPPAPPTGDRAHEPVGGPGESLGEPRPGSGSVRRARLVLTRLDPWSVMKLSFLLSLAAGIVFVTAVGVLWTVLQGMGVFEAVDRTAGDLTRGESGSGVNVASALRLGRVLAVAAALALVNAVLLTALATLGAFLYNLASGFVGGLRVTLTEDP